MPNFHIDVSDDKTESTLEIDGQRFRFNTLQLDALMKAIASARAEMLPAIPTQAPLGQSGEAILDPFYWTQLDPNTGNSLMLIRHPALGWLAFMLPAHERERITGYFSEQTEAVKNGGSSEAPSAKH